MPQSVEIPEIGEVEFPDSMTADEVAAASGRLYAEKKKPLAPPTVIPIAAPRPTSGLMPTEGMQQTASEVERLARGAFYAAQPQPLAAGLPAVPDMRFVAGTPRMPEGIEEPKMFGGPLESVISIPRFTVPKGEIPSLAGPRGAAVSAETLAPGAGMYNALAGAAEGLFTPATALTLGVSTAEQSAARLASGIWAAFMAKGLPEQVEEARKAFKEGKPLSEKVEKALTPFITAAMVGTAGKHALTPVERLAPQTAQAVKEPTAELKPGDILPETPAATLEVAKATPEVAEAPEPPARVSKPVPPPEPAPTAPQPSAAGIPAKREPWQMTRKQWAESDELAKAQEQWDENLDLPIDELRRKFPEADKDHELLVAEALQQGKPVPPEVLAGYPKLQPKPTPPIPEQPVKAGEAFKPIESADTQTIGTVKLDDQVVVRSQGRPFSARVVQIEPRENQTVFHVLDETGERSLQSEYSITPRGAFLERHPESAKYFPEILEKATPEVATATPQVAAPEPAISFPGIGSLTPMQKQYAALKAQHPNELVLIRIGDFYEAFWKDAETFAKDAGVALTKRQNVPMAGVPYHSVGKYVQQLEAKGHKVHVVENLREVTQPTPATSPEPAISFPGVGSLREGRATAMELGKIRKAEPELWKAITAYFGETQPGKVTKAAQAAFQRQREAQSRAASAGPGAASPVEFEQRAREQGNAAATGQKPPGENPPIATDASASPSIEVTRANRDYNILNRFNSGQFAFSFGKLGEAAKQAWERMALGEFRMRESIGRDTKRYVDQLLDNLPRPFRKKGGEAFFDVVNGKKLEDIEVEWANKDGGTEVIAAARELKTRLEEIRTTIRDTKREAYTAYLNSLDEPILQDLFRKNIDDTVDISKYPKASLADALAKDAYLDDWGIADGSYLPHLFFGNWKVTVTDAAGESRFVTRSKTPEEAKAEIFKLVHRNPELKDANFKVEQDTVVPADMIRLGDRRFWQLVGKMKEATGLTQGEVREAQQGIIGKKSSKQKWFGSLKKREGYEGYSRDYRQVMTAYLNGFHRWRELSQMQRDVQPLIETVRREGRQNAATRLDELMENLWGKPARTTLEFDALVQRIPGLRDYIKPLALDRWSRNARSAVAMATLKTLRFALVNRLQPLQGLYPLVGERILAEAKIAQHTKWGRELLDEAGVSFDPGQYRAERAGGGKVQSLSERFSGEKSNQELAFLAMYQHGIEQGLPKAEAVKYAKLRGQLFTQFTPLIADTPQLLQGPIAGLLFQFKRFPVKQAELLTRLVQEKRIGGIARWLGVMALSGGASYYLRQVYADAEQKKRLRDELAEQHGEKVADAIMYGMPGLVGADLSGSLVLGDEPFGENVYEKVGRSVVGPAAGIAIDTTRQLTTEKREPTTVRQDAVSLLKRFPTTRPLAELISLEDRDLDVRTPDGEVRYRKTLKDALLGLGSFRSANESNIKLAIDAMIELKKEIAELKNQHFVESEQGDPSKAEAAIDKFNERWPELEIKRSELREYAKLRRKGLDKTDIERISGKKLRPLAP